MKVSTSDPVQCKNAFVGNLIFRRKHGTLYGKTTTVSRRTAAVWSPTENRYVQNPDLAIVRQMTALETKFRCGLSEEEKAQAIADIIAAPPVSARGIQYTPYVPSRWEQVHVDFPRAYAWKKMVAPTNTLPWPDSWPGWHQDARPEIVSVTRVDSYQLGITWFPDQQPGHPNWFHFYVRVWPADETLLGKDCFDAVGYIGAWPGITSSHQPGFIDQTKVIPPGATVGVRIAVCSTSGGYVHTSQPLFVSGI